jgi:chromosome segregation ATPase
VNTRKAFEIDTLVLLEHARMEKKDAEAKRNQSEDRCFAALNDTAAAQKEVKAAMEEMAEVRAKLVASETSIRVSEHQVVVLSAKIKLLESQVKSLTSEIDMSQKETSKIAQELVDTQHLLTKTKNEYKVYVAEAEPHIDKAQIVEALKEELSKLRKQLEAYVMKLAKAASDASSGPMLLAGANKELVRSRDKVLALESEVRMEREAKEGFEGDMLQLKALVASLQERHVMLSTKMENSEFANRLLTHENDSLRNVIENLEKMNTDAKFAELTSREELARALLSIVSEERMRKQVQQTVTALDADIVALQLCLREAQDTILGLEMQLTGRKAEGAKEDFLKERVNCLIAQVTELTDTQAALRGSSIVSRISPVSL